MKTSRTQLRATRDDNGSRNPAELLAEASWISPSDPAALSDDGGDQVWVLGREFELTTIPTWAELFATADGLYECYINGVRVGDVELAPGTTAYQAVLDVQRYDVRSLLKHGHNTIWFRLSNGWFRGNNGTWRRRSVWGDQLALIAALHMPDEHVVTDATWTSGTSQVLAADLIDGQANDLRIDDWSGDARTPVLSIERDRSRLTWSPAPPVRRIGELRPVSVSALSDDRHIVDLGQNISGWARILSLGEAGNEVSLEFAEHLGPDGDISTSHLDSDAQELGRHVAFHQVDRVISGGPGRDVFEPRLTVHGFRYIRVDGYPRALTADDITGVLVHSDLTPTGQFESDDALLNRLHDAARWSFITNAVDVPTDCPTRERSGWTGDFQLFARSATYLYDIDGFGRRWLRSLAADQFPDGRVPNISPNNERQPDPTNPHSDFIHGSAGWSDAIVLVPWSLYTAYGDVQVLREQWTAIKRWLGFQQQTARTKRHPSRVARAAAPAEHEQYLWDTGFHWGEWNEGPQHDRNGDLRPTPTQMERYTSDPGELATGYFYLSVTTAARIAEIIGAIDESVELFTLGSNIKRAWQKEYLRPDATTVSDTQAAYVRALAFGLYPDELVSAGIKHLVDLIQGAGDRAETGFLSTPFVLPLLADNGHLELAYRILLQRESPSWIAMIERGATTLWEEWEGIDELGQAHASLNHYSRGAIVEFLYTHVLGIRPWPRSSPGFESVEVSPLPGGGLTKARGSLKAHAGTIVVEWNCAETFNLRVELPDGIEATIRLPSGSCQKVVGGTHNFEEALTLQTR